jgi:pyruvate formate lyase activating enzyme
MNTKLNKPSYIADYWHRKQEGIICTLCPHTCFLKNGETGICRTRKNIDNKLFSIVYGYPCSLQIDPVEKKPLYHFYPGSKTLSLSTIGCNLRCLNCQNHHISQADFRSSDHHYASPEHLTERALLSNCQSLSYTYTDPIVYYEYTRDMAILSHEKGLKNIIVSAGYINKKPLRDWCRYIDAANIDLKNFDDLIYQRLNGIRLKPVLQSLEILNEEGVWLEITNLIIPGFTDDLKMIKKMCLWLARNGFTDTPIHFSRFFPTYQLNQLSPTPINTMLTACQIALNSGLKYVYMGNVSNHKAESTYCPNCGTLLIERKGYLTLIKGLKESHCIFCDTKIPGLF